MTWTGSTTRTRPAKPSHVEWVPSEGQVRAVSALTSKQRCALWADPGAGKTSITLAAFTALKQSGQARSMLVVAPLRVCQLQWRQEALQWTQFRHLKILFLHGPKKDELLREQADIYLINFDGLVWLKSRFRGQLPFDVVCLDESTKIKNYAAERSKALRACTFATARKWMLTGTPNPNGYMDLFGQFLWLDGGLALGKHVTHFREKFFNKAFNGFDYDLQRGGGERIENRIADLVHRLPFTDLPPLINDVRWCEFSAEGKRLYRAMDKEQVITLYGGALVIAAGSTGAHQSAREQMAQGAIYRQAGAEEYVAFDDAKLDALDELIEEMNGQQLLVAFQFHHDIERIRARRGDIRVLAGGVSAKEAEEIQRAWNAGEIKELYVHPASIGHGLNLQRGGASHVCWFAPTFDLELWEQLIRRIWRQGNKAPRIVNHILAMKGTIDEDKLAAMEDKSIDQAQLLQSMEQSSALPRQMETNMNDARLGFQAGPASAPAPQAGGWGAPAAPSAATQGNWGPPAGAAAPAPQGGGWGAPAAPAHNPEIATRVQGGWAAPAEAAQQAPVYQPAQVQQAPTYHPEQGEGARLFSPEVQQAYQSVMSGTPAAQPTVGGPVESEKPKRASRAKAPVEEKTVDHSTKEFVPASKDSVDALTPIAESNIPENIVSVTFHGFPPHAVKAALLALAANL